MIVKVGSFTVEIRSDGDMIIDGLGGRGREDSVVHKDDRYDLFCAIRDALGPILCLACGGPDANRCQCENDE